jgi:hypothetical protein
MIQFDPLVKNLQAALGTNLKSVVLYGSAVTGDFLPGVSGYDVLIVVERLGAAELKTLAAPLASWQQLGNPLPQLFTELEIAHSADVFPIELLDMQQSRRILFGPDPLAHAKTDMQHYRMQLERELKTRLLLLRRGYLASAPNADQIARLMGASISSFLVLMRAALRLYNDSVPAEKADALLELTKHVPFDPEPLQTVQEMKKNKGQLKVDDVEGLFGKYLDSIEQVVSAVDRHLHPSS